MNYKITSAVVSDISFNIIQLQEMWDRIRSDVERVMDAEPGSCDLPFDAASDMPIEEQKYSYILASICIMCMYLLGLLQWLRHVNY